MRKITRTDKQLDNTFEKNSVVIFEQDFGFLTESFSMLFSSAIHGGRTGKLTILLGHRHLLNLENAALKAGWQRDVQEKNCWRVVPRHYFNAELLALLIGSGTVQETAVHLAAKILKSVDGDLNSLSILLIKNLPGFRGLVMPKRLRY